MNLVYPVLRPSVPWGASLLRVLDPEHSSVSESSPDISELTVFVEWGPSGHIAQKLNHNTVCTLTVRALSPLGKEPRQVCSAQGLYGQPFSVTWAIDDPAPQVGVGIDSILEIAKSTKKIECDVLKAIERGVEKTEIAESTKEIQCDVLKATGHVEKAHIKSRQWHIVLASEYIVDLKWGDKTLSQGGISDIGSVVIVPQSRCLHLIPPLHPDVLSDTYLSDIVAGGACDLSKSIGTDPTLHEKDTDSELTTSIRSITLDSLNGATGGAFRNLERAFGLEIESVTFCADPEITECFTKKQEVRKFIAHLMEEDTPQFADPNNPKQTSDHARFVARRQELLARIAKWDIIKERQMEQFGSHVAEQVYAQKRRVCTSLCEGGCRCREENSRVRALLGLELDKDDAWSRASLFNAEFKSPAPPYELSFSGKHRAKRTVAEEEARICTAMHELEPQEDWNGDAEAEVKVIFAVLKHLGAAMPPLTKIGHSSAGLHVHVNVCCPNAAGTPLSAKQILSVFLAWVRFEPVTRRLCKPWKWRDRSSGALWASGTEYQFDETVWGQGSQVSDREGQPCRYDLPAFFRAVYDVLSEAEAQGLSEAECDAALMRQVLLQPELLARTLSRNSSLNLVSVGVHGTVEFRRMDATLDAEWVLEWARFCVEFVDSFKDYEVYGRPFLGAPTAAIGLERLRRVQEACMMPHSFGEGGAEVEGGGAEPAASSIDPRPLDGRPSGP